MATAVEGAVNSGAADDSRGPVKVGGRFNTTPPTLTDGQRGDAQIDNRGNVGVVVSGIGVASTLRRLGIELTGNIADGAGANLPGTLLAAWSMIGLYNGSQFDRQRTPAVFKALAALSVTAEATIWTPGAGKKFRVMGFVFSASAAGNLTLKDNTAGTTILVVPLGTAVTVPSPPMGNGILSAAANNVLTATLSVAGTLSGFVFGTEE